MSSELDFGDGENNGDFVVVKEDAITDNVPLSPSDPSWNDYVLSLFTEDELIHNNPTVDGLRRVAEDVLGPIISSETEVLQIPHKDNDRRATVKVSLSIEYGERDIRTVDGVASVYWGNTDSPFRNYPVSTAETRAEGRALRRALRLRKILAAEEMGEVVDHDYSETDAREQGMITPQQIKFLGLMSQRLDINIQKFVNKFYSEVNSITEISHADSLTLQKKLSEYQQDDSTISKDIKGYNANWETKFR